MPEGMLFRFANEEIIYLLRSLQIAEFPGISPQPLRPLADEEKSLLMTEADHTLRARGLVHWRGETQREIDPLVTKLLLDCAQPGYTLFVDLLDAQMGARKLLYIFGPEATVEQCEPEPQVQQYLVLPTREAVARRLQALLMPQQEHFSNGTLKELPGGKLTLDRWQEALKAAHASQTATDSLRAVGLPAATAEALANALNAFQRVCYLGRWERMPVSKQDHPDAELTVVVGRARLFLLWPEQAESSTLTVHAVNAEQLKKQVAWLIPSTR